MIRWLKKESTSILGAATIVGVLSLVSRFVGFIRDRILAGTFGAGDQLDVYYAAFKIPDLMFQLIVVGALSASFIPLFTAHTQKKNGQEKAWEFTNNTLHLIGAAMVILSLVLVALAPWVASLIAPGFSEVKQLMVAQQMRIMLMAQVLLAVSMIYGSVLQSLKRFLIYSFAPIFYNLGIIGGALFLTEDFGVKGLAYGVVIGALLHLLTQIVGMHGTGYKYQWIMDWKRKDVRQMLKLMAPRSVGLAVNQVMFLVLTILASTLVAGSVTIFEFAYNIQFLPVGVIGVSFAVAVFPTLSELAQEEKAKKFASVVTSSALQMIYLLVPMSLLFLILRAQIVRVVVGAGEFDWAATIATADTLAFFALTFIPQALVFLFARSFYALQDTITPLAIAVVSSVVGVLSALILKNDFGVVALAMAYSLAVLVNMGLLWVMLRQRIGNFEETSFSLTFLKILAAGAVAGVTMQSLKPLVVEWIALDTFIGVFTQGFVAGGIGLVMYGVVAHVLRVPEQETFLRTLTRKVLRKAKPAEVIETH